MIKGYFYSATIRKGGKCYLCKYIESKKRERDNVDIHKVLVIMPDRQFEDWFENIESVQLYLEQEYQNNDTKVQ